MAKVTTRHKARLGEVLAVVYLSLGAVTVGKLTGHDYFPRESAESVAGWNVALVAVSLWSWSVARRRGRVFGFEWTHWTLLSVGAYAVGAVVALLTSLR